MVKWSYYVDLLTLLFLNDLLLRSIKININNHLNKIKVQKIVEQFLIQQFSLLVICVWEGLLGIPTPFLELTMV